MFRKNGLIVIVSGFVLLALFLVYTAVGKSNFEPDQVDQMIITNRQGAELVLVQAEAQAVAMALGRVTALEKADRIKTMFSNEITFKQAGDQTLSIKVANLQMFDPNKMQILTDDLPRDAAYRVADVFYQKLQEIADRHQFSLETD